MGKTVLLAEKELCFARELAEVLEKKYYFRVVGVTDDICQIEALVEAVRPDILVIDLPDSQNSAGSPLPNRPKAVTVRYFLPRQAGGKQRVDVFVKKPCSAKNLARVIKDLSKKDTV